MGERYEGYRQYSDGELIDRLRGGEAPIMDYICDKYKNLVRSKAKSSFNTFAELCINRQMYTAVQASKRKKHVPLNTYVPLDGEDIGDDREGPRLAELLADRTKLNPEEMFLDKERVAYLEKTIEEELSDFEKQVLDLYMTGMSYSQIAKVLGRDEKATDNALQRLKAKIKKIL